MKGRLVFSGALALAVLVACAFAASSIGKPQRQTAVSGNVTLSGWASSKVEESLLRQVLRGFAHTYPQIKVDYSPVNGDYPAAMLAKFAARNPPDVFYVDSNVIPDWIKQGVLEPLDSYVGKSKFNTKLFFPALLNGFKGPDGKLYGFPKDWSPLAMETNNAMLAAAGVKPPQTWAELAAAAKKIKVDGGKAVCLSPSWDRLLAFVYQNNGSFLNPRKTRATINSPAAKQAVNYYVGLIKSGVAATPSQLGVDWCGEALGKGKAAIIFEGNWVVPYMSDTFPNVKYTISKMVKGKVDGNLGFTVSYSMAKDSKNKEAAWLLLRYLVSRPGMKTWTSKGLALPSRTDVKPVTGRAAFLAAAPSSHPWQFAPTFSKVIDTANNELTSVIEGKESVDDMLSKVQDTANDALNQ
jgi:multiple sugar transport system substrate-binding protein